jgi:hypothetical protein
MESGTVVFQGTVTSTPGITRNRWPPVPHTVSSICSEPDAGPEPEPFTVVVVAAETVADGWQERNEYACAFLQASGRGEVWHLRNRHRCKAQSVVRLHGSFCGNFSGLGVHALPFFFPFSKCYASLFDLLFSLKPCEIVLLFVEVTPKLSSVPNFTQPAFRCDDPLLWLRKWR